ncbi:MAG: oxygenase MpaB family protein [Taibaiella sp.]|jgi:uncharacterized protein (DUF2236 family)
MKPFVDKDSIVRSIWGKSDTILFIFAGAAAEFSLNKAVDWLYFTGRLPADPIGRLFSTVAYAKQIIFSDEEKAFAAIDHIRMIHTAVESSRGFHIPDWAYRDVLFMLIYYSIASFELLERRLTAEEEREIYDVFYTVGSRMGVSQLPDNYNDWLVVRAQHLKQNLEKSSYTIDLYKQYRKHLDALRYHILRKAQSRLLPRVALDLLGLHPSKTLKILLPVYKAAGKLGLHAFIKRIFLLAKYHNQIQQLNVHTGT